jgi:phenylacetate-CoA ligase
MNALEMILKAAPRYFGLLQSQYWSPEKMAKFQRRRLEAVLIAAVKIPFYRERLGSDPWREDFAHLPRISRTDGAALHDSVLSQRPPDKHFASATSSGTSGPRAEYLFDRSHQSGRYAARARYLLANGWNPLQRSVWLVGRAFIDNDNPSDPFYEDPQFVSRALPGVRWVVNSTELASLAAEVAEIDPLFIYGYPSVLDGLLRNLTSANLRLPSLRRIFAGAELVEDSLRERAQRDFGIEIAANYGSTEAFLAWQCPAGSYHQNAEHVLVEVVDDVGRAVAPGQMGHVLLTTLENHLMPLVRYDIGDYAFAANGSCSCGRTLPLLGQIVGRGMNLFRTVEGKLMTTWDLVNVLTATPELETFQIVQKTLNRVIIRYTAAGQLTAAIEKNIRVRFVPYLGDAVSIDFERVAEVPRTAGGKFMITLSELVA